MVKKDNVIKPPMSLGDLLLNTPSAIIVANSQGNMISVSSATQDMLGWTPGELIGKKIVTIIPDRLRPLHLAGFRRWSESGELTLSGKSLRTMALRKDGTEFPVQLTLGSYSSEDGDLRVVGMLDNIQEVIDLEKRSNDLQRELDFVRSVVMNLGEAIIATDLDGKITLANPLAVKLLGWTEEEMRGKISHYLFHSNEANNFMKYEDCYLQKSIRTKGTLQADDYFKTKSGKILSIHLTTAPIYRDGIIAGAVDIFEDISERKAAELALSLSELKYRELVELSPDGIAIHTDGKFIFANKALLRLMKAENFEDIQDMHILDFIHPDYRDLATKRIKEALDNDKELPLQEEKGIDLQGNVIDIEIATIPMMHLGKKSITSIVRDISSRKELQEYQYILTGIVDSNDDSIIAYKTDGTIVAWNSSAERMYGWSKEEMLNKNIKSIVVDCEYFEKTLRIVFNDQRVDHQTVQRRTKDGREIKVDINISPIRNGIPYMYGASEIGREFDESQIVSSNSGPSISR